MYLPTTPKIIGPIADVGAADRSQLSQNLFKRLLPAIMFVLLLILLIFLRVIHLDSDAYPRLSWSSALLTDEGFYIHNARNLVLFGHERTDDFNNALLMPILHFVQVIVFRYAGVGAVQARSISVIISLLTLMIFFAALRRAFGTRVAWLGVLLLGLDPVFVLYNRLALMDTPACLPLCAAFYSWVRGEQLGGEQLEREHGINPGTNHEHQIRTAGDTVPVGNRPQSNKLLSTRLLWLFACGLCLGISYAVRGLAVLAAAAPILILLLHTVKGVRKHQRLRDACAPLAAFVVGITFVFSIYFIVWYLPHRNELAFLNKYYVQEQLLPHSLYRLQRDIVQAFVHPYRGVFPYLCKHSPLLLVMGAFVMVSNLIARVKQLKTKRPLQTDILKPDVLKTDIEETDAAKKDLSKSAIVTTWEQERSSWAQSFLMGWVTVFMLFVCVVDYAPSRYYILFYPPLAALAALGLDRVAHLRVALPEWLSATVHKTRSIPSHSFKTSSAIMALILCLWGGLNLYWYTDWFSNMSYRQRDADAWLATHLPADSVLIGATAPGLCLNNHFRCVNMIDHLCNYNRPVERFAPSPRYIVILDQEVGFLDNMKKIDKKKSDSIKQNRSSSKKLIAMNSSRMSQLDKRALSARLAWANRWRENWWAIHYAEIIKPEKRLHAFPKLIRPFFTVGIYAVPFDFDYISSYYEKMAGVRKEF